MYVFLNINSSTHIIITNKSIYGNLILISRTNITEKEWWAEEDQWEYLNRK